jgi:hypothetical protein
MKRGNVPRGSGGADGGIWVPCDDCPLRHERLLNSASSRCSESETVTAYLMRRSNYIFAAALKGNVAGREVPIGLSLLSRGSELCKALLLVFLGGWRRRCLPFSPWMTSPPKMSLPESFR